MGAMRNDDDDEASYLEAKLVSAGTRSTMPNRHLDWKSIMYFSSSSFSFANYVFQS
jgi:hypothetical protein